jgi:hypothetical protein
MGTYRASGHQSPSGGSSSRIGVVTITETGGGATATGGTLSSPRQVEGCGPGGGLRSGEYDKINPRHYKLHPSGIECIDVIEQMPFNVGSAIKYLWRVGLVPDEEPLNDLKKAAWYVSREIARVEKSRECT